MSFGERLTLEHCRLGPAQTWGSLRWIPILRSQHRHDLRLSPQAQSRDRVASTYPNAVFTSYIPQALVLRWDADGQAEATEQTHLDKYGSQALGKLWKRRDPRQLAFLPQSLAIEGFLVRHFGGPRVAWLDYQREVRRGTLGVRWERTLPGWYIKGLEEALRCFEWAPHQVGCALLQDEELVQLFLTPHPHDYACLHESLLTDAYPEHLVHYGYLRYRPQALQLGPGPIHDLASLKTAYSHAVDKMREEEQLRLDELVGPLEEAQSLYKTSSFQLWRFLTGSQAQGRFAGEAIWHSSGTLEYLKLFRLSRAQCRRHHLLSTLARCQWEFEQAAPMLGVAGRDGVARSLIEADLGYLLNPGLYGHLLRGRP